MEIEFSINAIHRTWLGNIAWCHVRFVTKFSALLKVNSCFGQMAVHRCDFKVTLKGMRTTVEKDILNGISGSVNPGEVLTLMGPSGSGKTTLLNLLGGRLIQPTVGDLVTYNDQPYSKFLKSRIGFVTQDDVTYAALLRLPKTLTREQKEKRAVDVIYELGLERCQDTTIGGSFVRGVSDGERKRVRIGNEIIINPSLLFLDEPTSGLDSTTALRTVQMLHDTAEFLMIALKVL
ncbi:hypothetical protein I3760_10G020300 [Carya illinoinensis]|nr:hypothetical protein I3760_10G020300 [Carya illinoinensis]